MRDLDRQCGKITGPLGVPVCPILSCPRKTSKTECLSCAFVLQASGFFFGAGMRHKQEKGRGLENKKKKSTLFWIQPSKELRLKSRDSKLAAVFNMMRRADILKTT